MILAFLLLALGSFCPPMREQKLYFLPNEYMRSLLFNDYLGCSTERNRDFQTVISFLD